MQPIETVRQFVNTWECDENNHVNVQFYFLHFATADAHFWAQAGLKPSSKIPVASTQYVRFHKELEVGDMIVVNSHLAPHGDGFALCHVMTNSENEALLATSWSPLSNASSTHDAPVSDADQSMLPRSFDDKPFRPITMSAVMDAGYKVSLRSLVQTIDCDADGSISTRGLVGNLSNASSQFWSHVGFDKAWLNTNNYGRVTIEFKLAKLSRVSAGTPLAVYTGLTGFSRKTISFRHYVFDANTGQVAWAGEVAGLAIDQTSRRSVEWPKDHQALLEAHLVTTPTS